MDWPGLLKWTMKNTEGGNTVDKDIKPMSEEDAKWLEEAFEHYHFNEMKEIMKILDKLKEPEKGTQEDSELRCNFIEDLLVLIDGLENNRNIVRAKRFHELISYFFNTQYYNVKYEMAGVLSSMMQNDKLVQNAAADLGVFNILNVINETSDDKLLAKCIYILTGLIYGDNLHTKILFLENYEGLSLIYNLIIKHKNNITVFKRILNILREMTKIEDNDSELNQIRLKSLLKIMDLKLNTLVLQLLASSSLDNENKEEYENHSEIRVIIYDLLINICKSFSSLNEIFEVLTSFNESISKSNLPDDIKKYEKSLIIDEIKRLKAEYIRKEEVKAKDTNVQKLDDRAVLLNLKKEDENINDKEQNKDNEITPTNISTSTNLCFHPGNSYGNALLSPSEDKKEI